MKSGPSYLDEQTDDAFIYRGSRRHLDYWRNHSLPVLLILVDVEKEIAYWAEIDDSVVVTGEGWKEPRRDGRAATGELVLAQLGERVFLGRWWMKQGRRVLMDAVIQPITDDADLRVIDTVTVIVRHETPGGRRRQ